MRGIVSAEAKKKRGEYVFKMLCVDVPTTTTVSLPHGGGGGSDGGGEPAAAGEGELYRIFLHGSQAEYDKQGVMAELREPFLQAAEAENDFEIEEDGEELEEVRERRERIMQMRPKPLSEGGGMFRYERAYERAREAAARAANAVRGGVDNLVAGMRAKS